MKKEETPALLQPVIDYVHEHHYGDCRPVADMFVEIIYMFHFLPSETIPDERKQDTVFKLEQLRKAFEECSEPIRLFAK